MTVHTDVYINASTCTGIFLNFWGIEKMVKVYFFRHEVVQVSSIVASMFLFFHRYKSCKYLDINVHSVPNASLGYAAILWRVKCSWYQSPVLIIGSRWTSFSLWFPVKVLHQSRQLGWFLQTEGMKLFWPVQTTNHPHNQCLWFLWSFQSNIWFL